MMAQYRVLYTINYKNGDASRKLTETVDAPDKDSICAAVLKLEQEREHYCPVESVKVITATCLDSETFLR